MRFKAAIAVTMLAAGTVAIAAENKNMKLKTF